MSARRNDVGTAIAEDLFRKKTELDSMTERWSSHRGNAAYVVVADVDDDEDRCVDFNLVPGEEILIGCANARHEELSEPLAKNCADSWTRRRL